MPAFRTADPHTVTINHTKTISVNTTIDRGGLITISGNHAVRVRCGRAVEGRQTPRP